MRTGVLLINLGTPKSPQNGDVFTYLNEFLTDGRVIDLPWLKRQLLVRGIIVPFRYKNSARTYREIWHPEKGSPLMYHSMALLQKVRAKLPDSYVVELGMRYEQPSIEEALLKLKAQKVGEIIVLPLYPQYASSSTGTAVQRVFEVISRWTNIPRVRVVNSFCTDEGFIDAFVDKIRKHDLQEYDHVLFSYHGLPLKHIFDSDDSKKHCKQGGAEGCCEVLSADNQFCYRAQCTQTTKAFVRKLNLEPGAYSMSFQSRLGKEEWVKPYTIEMIEELARAGKKKVLVVCPAFTADCLETVFEISVEYQDEFEKFGGEKLQLVESLNDSDQWVDAVVDLVK